MLQSRYKHWQLKAIPILLVLSVVVIFYPSISRLFEHWIRWDEGLAHGLPVIAVFFYLLFDSAPWAVVPQAKKSYYAILVLIFCGSMFWFFAKSINIFILDQITLVPMLFLLVAACYGWRASYNHRMLLLMPIFSIPVWESLNGLLVNLSSFIVGVLVQVIGMSAMIDGNSIYLPFGQILIADGCSGIRYLVISLALGYILSYLNGYTGFKLFLVMAVSTLLGLVANWARIFILVVVGFQTKMQSDLMINHEYFGWWLFAAIALPAIYFAPVLHLKAKKVHDPEGSAFSLSTCVAPILIMCIGPALNLFMDQKITQVTLKDQLSESYGVSSLERMPMPVLSPNPQYVEKKKRGNIFVQIDQYQRLDKHDKLVPPIERLYDKDSWTIQEQIDFPDVGADAELVVFKNKNTHQNIAQLQWFQLGAITTHKIIVAKLLQIPAQLHHENHFMIVSLQTKCSDYSCELAKSQLKSAAQSITQNLKSE